MLLLAVVIAGAGEASRVPSVEQRVSALLAEDLFSSTIGAGFLIAFLTIRGELSMADRTMNRSRAFVRDYRLL
jgi:hypothetical protein